jgi:hypothetical protein
MSTTELREEIHKKVDSLDINAKLFEVNHTLDLLLSSSLSEGEKFLLNRLNQAIIEEKEGKLIPHEIVSKEAKEWLKR